MSSHQNNLIAPDGFSLIELLLVMGVLILLSTMAVPAISSIGSSRGVSQAAYDVSALIDLARNEAVSRQTYVWVGFQPQTNNGNLDLRMGLVYSKDGSTNTVSTNLQSLSRPLTVQRVGLFDASTSTPGLGSFPEARFPTGTGLDFTIGGVRFSDRRTITFTPRGEAMLSPAPAATDGFQPQIGLGLRQARGLQMQAGGTDAAVIIDGSIGLPRIYRVE